MAGSVLYVVDGSWAVVRAIDSRTPGTSTVVAGNGIATSRWPASILEKLADSADGSPATGLPLVPQAVAAGPDGKIYIAESCRIRAVSPGADGVINAGGDEALTTVAGNATPGVCGYGGDGGPATAASWGPDKLAMNFDSAGRLYVSDRANCVVWLVEAGWPRDSSGVEEHP